MPTGRATGAIGEFAAEVWTAVERRAAPGSRREARNENRIGGSAARAESRAQWVSGRRVTPERNGPGPAAPGSTARPGSVEGQANLTRGGRRRRRWPDDDRSAVGIGRRGDGLHVSPRGREPPALKRDRSDGPAPHVPPRHSRGKSPEATARSTVPVIGTNRRETRGGGPKPMGPPVLVAWSPDDVGSIAGVPRTGRQRSRSRPPGVAAIL